MAFPEAERPNISVVSPDDMGGPRVAPSPEPEAQPPAPAFVPPQDTEPSIGGPTIPAPSAEEIVEGSGGGLADRMRARFASMASTEEFPVPGWELENGDPGLVLVARAFGDRKGYNKGISNEAFIAKSTYKLLYCNDDGSREEIPGGWGPALAQLIGCRAEKAADLVAYVISKPNPDHPTQRIPNVAGIGALATDIIAWSRKSYRDAEDDLGE